MAELTFDELVAVLEANPQFREKWEHDTRASEALRIYLGERGKRGPRVENFELADGHEFVASFTVDDKLYVIEIC
jgi:hypothetical protein